MQSLKERANISVAVAGDISMRNLSHKISEEYARDVFSEIKPILERGDIRIVNLENPLIDNGTPIAKSGPALKGMEKDIVLVKEGGFDCAILANNHIGDYGDEGVISTIKLLEEWEIGHVGAGRNIEEAWQPFITKANGLTVAILAVAENEFGISDVDKPGAAGVDMYRLYHTIQSSKQKADFVMVVFHGGNEYNPLPSPGVVSRYRLAIDFGADAVVGMHPHCPQGYETYNGKPIVYSVGNFLFCERSVSDPNSPWYYGYIPIITFAKDGLPTLDITPYTFDPECTRITPMEGERRRIMLEYLDKISSYLIDPKEHIRLFKGWCLIGGPGYASHLEFSPDFLEEDRYFDDITLLRLRNLFTCEAHNELMTTLLKMVSDRDLKTGYEMVEKVKALQKMPVENICEKERL